MPRFEDIQFRRGTAAEWFAVNPVLDEGEPGFETDTGKLKVGDGSSTWNGLSYFVGGAGPAGADGAAGPAGPAGPMVPGADGDDADSMWYPPPGSLLGMANFWNAEQRYGAGFVVQPSGAVPVITLSLSGAFSMLGGGYVGQQNPNSGDTGTFGIYGAHTTTTPLAVATQGTDDGELAKFLVQATVMTRIAKTGEIYVGGKKVLHEGNLGSIPFLIPEDVEYDYPWPTGGGAAAAAAAAPSAAYATSIGDGASTSFNVDHALGTLDVQVAIYRNSTGAEIEADVTRSTVNRVVVAFVTTPSSNEYRVVVR